MVQGGVRETQDKVPEGKALQQRSVVALKGQLLHWRLLVANAGQHTCYSMIVGREGGRVRGGEVPAPYSVKMVHAGGEAKCQLLHNGSPIYLRKTMDRTMGCTICLTVYNL